MPPGLLLPNSQSVLMKLQSLVAAALAAVAVAAQEVTGVFSGISSVVPQVPNQRPLAIWTTTVDWGIDGSKVSPGDTFHLTLPGVFLFAVKTLDLKVGDTVYAHCTMSGGVDTDGTLKCTATNAVTPTTEVYGEAWFQVFLCQGFAFESGDLHCLSFWQAGLNTWTINDGANDFSYTFNIQGEYDPEKSQGKRGGSDIVRTGVCADGYDLALILASIAEGTSTVPR